MEEIKSFTFYRDFYNLIDTMSLNDKKELAVAILDYIFKGTIPNLKGHNQAIFNTLKHQLDKSKNKSRNAQKSQSNENQNEIKSETKDNQKEIKSKSNENQNEIKQGNKTSILSFKFYISNFIVNNFKNLNVEEKKLIGNKLLDWCKYKQEKNKTYKETGLKVLLTQVEKNVTKYGLEKVLNLIDECMANNYQGIIWEKLENKKEKVIAGVPSWMNKKIESEKVELNEKQRREFETIKNGTYRPEDS